MADLARMLQVLSRLYIAAGLAADADATLDEMISAAGTVTGQGPVSPGSSSNCRPNAMAAEPGAEVLPHGIRQQMGLLATSDLARTRPLKELPDELIRSGRQGPHGR